jgi:hypothetical protein
MNYSTWQVNLNQSRTRKRLSKTDLLPLPKKIADVLSLEYHLLLESLRAGVAHVDSLRIILRVGLATTILSREGYGNLEHSFDVLEAAALHSFERGLAKGEYRFDQPAFSLFADVLTVHDRQIARAPVSVIARLADEIE